ncbi:Quercetin 2,3-dioxygenase [Granulosicoccus antarcticus IMCC3135]|uniref:Quercetin 2,3-dioxygenase n=2 Tax=Granulosicoccus TaxID=437504 RepID=A0A2Z2NZC4_9GAMM|nr:Quercetin 2,3-dioxygenase [Granulosicoccus antarcticus IMCC3135]
MTRMNMTVRHAADRGMADHGWLKSAHTFSFANYHDPEHMQYGPLRVINDDEVAGGGGFPPHQHQDAEIFSYVLEGSLEHKDSLGNGSTVSAGGVQYMSAGSGVVHSEFNPSADERVRFLQVWLLPSERGATPRYETMVVNAEDKAGKLKLFLSPDGRDGSMATRAQALVHAATLNGEQRIEHDLGVHEKAWLQVAAGTLRVNDVLLVKGDGVAIDGGGTLVLEGGEQAEVLLFEM